MVEQACFTIYKNFPSAHEVRRVLMSVLISVRLGFVESCFKLVIF